jgi:uncharacterized protein (TIGR02270 family)
MIRPAIPKVLQQHVEDAAVLHSIRTKLTFAPHVKLKHIRRFDDRLAAHLDGLLIAGESAWPLVDEALAPPSPGAMFAATVLAIESRSSERLNHLYAVGEAVPNGDQGLVSAFGWVDQNQLRGIANGLLASPHSFLRYLGVAACSVHRVDPGRARDAAIEGASSAFRARSLRAAGELGRKDLLPTLVRQLDEGDENNRFWIAWSAVMLGDQNLGLTALKSIADAPGPFHSQAFRLSLQAMSPIDAQAWLRQLAGNPTNLGSLIQGAGIAGDPHYVPWLIQHMNDKKTARLAGESFSLIAGVDLAYLDLERKPPADSGAGPNDDPNDANVGMDEDDGLPWPDPERIADWWRAHGGRFESGMRYFLGAPVTRENCLRILKEGFQRQRILAAHYLCLLEPGTTLFEWRAPAARQQRLLAAMG